MRIASIVVIAAAIASASAASLSCDSGRGLAINEIVEARGLAADIHSGFMKAVDKSSEAVMATSDEASVAAAHEAEDSRKTVAQKIDRLQTLLKSLAFDDEQRQVDQLKAKYSEYEQLDEQILALAIENSNIKAQRLMFGPGRESVEVIRAALAAAVAKVPARAADRAHALSAEAVAALLEVQVIEGRHIAESEDAPMTEMEKKMDGLLESARHDIEQLPGLLPKGATADLAPALDALERFKATHGEIVHMSRRNTNVRSEALTLGHKRTLAAACDEAMAMLSNSLAGHQFVGTR